jgi:hypothetical protein
MGKLTPQGIRFAMPNPGQPGDPVPQPGSFHIDPARSNLLQGVRTAAVARLRLSATGNHSESPLATRMRLP